MTTYKVILEGTPLPGFDSNTVRDGLAKLTGISPEEAKRLLSGNVSTVKHGLDQQTAARYLVALRRVGAACRTELDHLQIDTSSDPQHRSQPTAPSVKKSHLYGWIALIAFLMSNFSPAIVAPLIVLVGLACAVFEASRGSKLFGGVMLALCALQAWYIADHFGKISGAVGLTSPKQIERETVSRYSSPRSSVPVNAEDIISTKCTQEWPSDYRMQKHCADRQQQGIAALATGRPNDVSPDAFTIIRGKCAEDWPRDFSMRAHCESRQVDGYVALQSASTPESKRGRCAQQWPNDYQMRQHCESR